MFASLPPWVRELLPIVSLLVVIAIVVRLLPKVELGHTPEFRRRRFWNWFPAGMTYAFLYFARYNLTAYKNSVGMTNDAYGTIDQWGAIVYGFSFLINGPLADKIGGRKTLLLAALGGAGANLAMAAVAFGGWSEDRTFLITVLYATNMYFQSFGAVSIVKVNAAWFHLRERGTFGGIFGILISLGLYFAYDLSPRIAKATPHPAWVFIIPPLLLLVAAVADYFLVRDTPGQAGHRDFETGDASSNDDPNAATGLAVIVKRMLTNPTILVIAGIEFCSGYLRNAIMKWYQVFAKATGAQDTFVPSNWGMLLACAGIFGGMFAGAISDHLFQSRRGPVSTILYGGILGGCGMAYFTLDSPLIGWVAVFMSLCVIGVHGMLSGTASMDFGGKKNVGVVVGIIDGFVYLGTAFQAGLLKNVLPERALQKGVTRLTKVTHEMLSGTSAFDAFKAVKKVPIYHDPATWSYWPVAMVPLALLGMLLATRVWNATAKGSGGH